MNAFTKNLCSLTYLLIFQTLDIILSSVLFAKWDQWYTSFVVEVKFFTVYSSLFELWVFSALRSVLLYGSILGFVLNSEHAISRIKKLDYVALFLSAAMWAYTLIKLLTYSQENSIKEVN